MVKCLSTVRGWLLPEGWELQKMLESAGQVLPANGQDRDREAAGGSSQARAFVVRSPHVRVQICA